MHSLTVEEDHNYIAGSAQVLTVNCASMMGHDFRPAYSRLHEITSIVTDPRTRTRPPILAVTATATPDIEDEIVEAVGMREHYVRIIGDPIRPNITMDVAPRYGSEWSEVRRIVERRFSMPGRHLIYAGTRAATEKVVTIVEEILGKGSALYYHGGMEKADRTRVQEAFVSGRVSVVVATNAFGMGIDVPDIRTVVHFGIPGSIEAYSQEIGRAGRDQKPSVAILIPSSFSEDLQQRFVDNANPPVELYAEMWAFLRARVAMGARMRKTARSIAFEMGRDMGADIDEAQVTTILNMLEAHGIVKRDYYAGGTPVTLDLAKCGSLGDPNGNATERVAASLVRMARTTQRGSNGGTPDAADVFADQLDQRAASSLHAPSSSIAVLDVERGDLAAEARCTTTTVGAALRALGKQPGIKVGRIFTGKTTERLIDDEQILDRLPIDELERKRQKDQRRLDLMIHYGTLDVAQRVQLVRDYFRKGES